MKKIVSIRFHFHPIIFALYPVLALLAANVSQVYYVYTLRSLISCMALSIFVYVISALFIRNREKSVLIATILLVAFFSYGHVLYFLRDHPVAGLQLGRHHFLIFPYLVFFGILIVGCLRSRSSLIQLNQFLDLASLILIAFPLIRIVSYYVQLNSNNLVSDNGKRQPVVESVSSVGHEDLPDIYYIILDGYARQDKLEYEYGFDNQPFINQLREIGFYVADCNRSNYNITDFSLASSLNMDYLTAFGSDYRSTGPDRDRLHSLIINNKVREKLEAAGYRTFAFETGYYFTEWWDADEFLAPGDHFSIFQSLRPFETLFLKSTFVLFLSDSQILFFNGLNSDMNFPYNDHVKRVQYTLDTLPTLASVQGPKFVFVHILVPHKPLVFDSEGYIQKDDGFYALSGDPINGDYFQRGYLEEIEFINSRIPSILKEIIDKSEKKPVIILNSDHGVWWGVKPSHANLGAYYLPGDEEDKLYSHISNVNVFRLVMNGVFSSKYDLLPDISYNLDDTSENGFSVQPEYLQGCMTEENSQFQ